MVIQQILKPLELIKTSISLEDDEIIESQIATINTLNPDNVVCDILEKLSQHRYSSALIDIDNYLVKRTRKKI